MRVLRALENHLGTYFFPAFALFLLFFYKVVMLALLLIPAGESGLGAFAHEFRVWCFGLSPETGELQMSYVWTMFGEFLLFGVVIVLVWYKPLRDVLRARPLLLRTPALLALVIVSTSTSAFALLYEERKGGALPFPAEALRTSYELPRFSLRNQEGEMFESDRRDGRILILSGIYSTCPHTCPLIVTQLKETLSALTEEERAAVTFALVTLDPERDAQASMKAMALRHDVAAPQFNFLVGDAVPVMALHDRLGITSRKEGNSGVISHANVFLLVDRRGRIAYRFTLGEQQKHWLLQAIRILVRE